MINDVKKTSEQRMAKSIEALKHDFAKIRTGRAHTGLLDHIHVDYYGAQTPLNQVASVTLADPYARCRGPASPHTSSVQVWPAIASGVTTSIVGATSTSPTRSPSLIW